MLDAELRLPVFFECVDANLAIRRDIRVLCARRKGKTGAQFGDAQNDLEGSELGAYKYFCQKVSLRGLHWKALAQDELESKETTEIRRVR